MPKHLSDKVGQTNPSGPPGVVCAVLTFSIVTVKTFARVSVVSCLYGFLIGGIRRAVTRLLRLADKGQIQNLDEDQDGYGDVWVGRSR